MRTVLPGSWPARASSWTAGRSVSGRRAATPDLEVTGVDPGDQGGQLGGVAVQEDRHRAYPALGVFEIKGGRAHVDAAVGDQGPAAPR
jgi:hypothetical protein